MGRPKIGIDLHTADGFYQGLRTHVLELFGRVIEISPDMDFYLFLDRPGSLRERSGGFVLPHAHVVHMPASSPVVRLCGQLPRLQKQYGLDLLHMQNILPFPSASPCMVTIHDVLFEAYPQFFPRFFTMRSKLLMRSAAAKSAHVFTVSEYSRNEIIRRYSVAPDRISVLYNGVDGSRYVPGVGGGQEIEACGLMPGDYILSIGRLDARKNHVSLIEAYARLTGPVPTLVIAGQRSFGHEKVHETVNRLRLQEKVRILENVDDDLLPALYRHAKLFVYPSWAEGFGMPPVEAMASGVPVICSNTTALPEVVGANGILVAPGNVGELAAAMYRVLSDNVLSQRLRALGLERARSFKWETAARTLRDVYVSFFGGVRREVPQ